MSLIGNDLYRFDDFELQPARRALLRSGEKIQITPKSFEVLLCLVQNAGRVVLKEEILKSVWPESFVEESNLTQHIFWLRKALGDKGEYIVTIPGRGYEFNAPVQAISEATVSSSGPGVSFRIQQATEVTRVVVEERRRPVAAAPSKLSGPENRAHRICGGDFVSCARDLRRLALAQSCHPRRPP